MKARDVGFDRARQYADALAARIRAIVEEAPYLPSTKRPLTPGDILVLVRSRGELASLIVARLFTAGVPVAGVDRLHLHEPLAVQDLLAAVKFAVQPNDDLSLACLLVSPLIGWDQERLRALAYGRKGRLWRELRERAGENEAFTAAHEALRELLRNRRFHDAVGVPGNDSGPGRWRGGARSTRALAWRFAIPFDELMNSAIEFERTDTASLHRSSPGSRAVPSTFSATPGRPANDVRVMTVHGAKGLEAPVVNPRRRDGRPRAARANADHP